MGDSEPTKGGKKGHPKVKGQQSGKMATAAATYDKHTTPATNVMVPKHGILPADSAAPASPSTIAYLGGSPLPVASTRFTYKDGIPDNSCVVFGRFPGKGEHR